MMSCVFVVKFTQPKTLGVFVLESPRGGRRNRLGSGGRTPSRRFLLETSNAWSSYGRQEQRHFFDAVESMT